MIFIVYKCDECGEFEYEVTANSTISCNYCGHEENIPGNEEL